MGPLSLEDVRKRILDGKLRLYDLLYREGQEQWRMALEFTEFKDDFALSPYVTTAGKVWVLLHRKTAEAKDFVTSGPYSQSEVITRLKSGKIQYTDYAWREGFKQWVRLSSLEEFSPQGFPEKREIPPTPVEAIMSVPAESLLSKVVQLKRKVHVEPLPPSEALVGIPKPPVNVIEKNEVSEPEVAARGRRHRRRYFASVTLFEWFLGLFMICALLGGLYLVGSSLFGSPEPVLDPPDEVSTEINSEVNSVKDTAKDTAKEYSEQPIQSSISKSNGAPVTTPSIEKVQTISSGVLKLNVKVSGTQFDFSIRSGSKDPVNVQIIGRPGQVVGVASYYKYLRLLPKEDGLILLDSSRLVLPAGRYLLRASRGDVVREEKFSLGTQLPEFKAQISRTRKNISQELWRERMRLIRMGAQLELYLAQKMRQPKKPIKLGELAKLDSVKFASGGNYLFFEHWWELKEIFSAAKANPSPELLMRLVEVRRELSVLTIWK